MILLWIKRGLIVIAILFLLIAGIILLLHTPAGKSFVRLRAESYLQKKWQTEVAIGSVDYRLPNWITLEKVLVLDRQSDTLLNGGRIYAGINIWKLLSNSIEITGVELEAITLRCQREAADSVFNFQFILDAFSPAKRKDPSPSPGAPMQLSVKQLYLDQVRFELVDKREKFYLYSFIGHFSCFPNELNLEKTAYHFHEVLAKNSNITIVDSSLAENSADKIVAADFGKTTKNVKKQGGPSTILFSLNKLALQNIHYSYKMVSGKEDMDILLDSLQLNHATLDLGRQLVTAGSIRLANTAAKLYTWVPASKSTKKGKEASLPASSNSWSINVDTICLQNNSFVYHNAAVPAVRGIDYQHLNVQGLSLEARQTDFDAFGFYIELDKCALKFNEQLNIKGITAKVLVTDSLVKVIDLVAAVNRSQLTTRGDMVWPLKPAHHRREQTPRVLISRSQINYGDLLLIQPNLNKLLPVSFSPSEMIELSGNFTGPLKDFQADHLQLSTSSQSFLLNGSLGIQFGAGNSAPGISANIQQLKLKKQLLSKDLLRQLEKANLVLPGEITVTGRVQMLSEKLTTDLKMNSPFGQLIINGTVNHISSPQRLTYAFRLDALNLETGKWIRRDSLLGKVTGQVFIKGAGLEIDKLNAETKLQLKAAIINGYPFSNINLLGGYAKSSFLVKGGINDPNLVADLDLSGRINDPALKGTIHIEKADLYKLGLTPDSIDFAGHIKVDASYNDRKEIAAAVWADSIRIQISGKQFNLDSVYVICNGDKDSTSIWAQAPFLSAELKINYTISLLSSELTSFLQALYPIKQTVHNERMAGTGDHQTTLHVQLTQSDLLSALIPKLELEPYLTLKAKYEPGNRDSGLFIQALAPGIRYNQLQILDLNVKAESIDSVFRFALAGRDLFSGDKHLTQPSITGHLQKDQLFVQARVNDDKGKEFYAGKLETTFGVDGTVFRLPEDLILNYNKWKVSPDNKVLVRKEGIVIDNFSLEHKGQTIYINTKGQDISPIDIRIDSFEIGNLLALVAQSDTPLARGTLKADISIQQPIQTFPRFTGVVQARNLYMYNIPVGDLVINSSTTGDSLTVEGGLSGNNQIDFNGHIHAKNGGMSLETHLKKFDMGLVQGFTKEFLSRVSGQITGDLKLDAGADKLSCQGVIYFDSAAFAVNQINTLYRINRQKLIINYPEILLNGFSLTDTAGRQLTVQGRVTIISPSMYGLNIDLETKDFTALQATRHPESTIYGTGILDAKMGIRGTSSEPIIEGSAFLQGKSRIHYMLSQTSDYTKARKGRLEFVDIDTLALPGVAVKQAGIDTAVTVTSFKGLKYNLSLEVSKDAEFSVIINPTTNDELVVKGEARLQAGVDESGLMALTGVYRLQSGHYSLNNQLLRRKFQLIKGSTITFNGDPLMAVADITTQYEVVTSPSGLLETTSKDKDDGIYNKRLPFLVVFTIRGPISKPELAFDIKLKEGATGIENALKSAVDVELSQLRNNVTEMNKQVFSLLVTSRFSPSGENSLTGNDFNADDAVKDGISQFLTEAMNQVADDLIKGVDINMSLKSYETGSNSSSKTDLGVSMSKDLLKDRLTVTLGSNFTVSESGDAQTVQKDAAHYVPDITTTYKLSKDGRFKVKTYLKNEYDAVVEGYFSETGVSFTIELEYNKLKELVQHGAKANKEKP